MPITALDVYDRTEPAKKYDKHLIRAGRVIQSAEINEIQTATHARIKTIGDALWKDGEVIAGLGLSVDGETGKLTCGEGTIIHRRCRAGRRRERSPHLSPPDQRVVVGVWFTQRVVDEIMDGTLRNPAVGTPDFQQPGALRRQTQVRWGLESDSYSSNDYGEIHFYPLYTLSNRQVISQPKIESSEDSYLARAVDIVRRYDNESNGSYVVDGLAVSPLEPDTVNDGENKHVYNITAGKAHVLGHEVAQPFALRLVVDENPIVMEVEDEVQRYNEAGGAEQVIYFKHTPVTNLKRVSVEKEKTVQIEHGAMSGASDKLPDNSVMEIRKVWDSSRTYTLSSDYRLTNDSVNWSPSGDEPAPGGSYQVTYTYKDVIDVDPESWDTESIKVSGLVQNSDVSLQYSYKLPRYDLICVNTEGVFSVVYGVSHMWQPVPPTVPTGLLKLATIKHTWEGLPEVSNDGIRVTTMAAQASMSNSILDLYDLVSQERLKTDALASAPTTSRGVFVDPFLDDDMRDAGIDQTAAIVDGTLMLPIGADVTDFENFTNSTLDYTDEIILSQTARTASMKINAYQAKAAPPANVGVSPVVDRWEEYRTNWASATTATIVNRLTNAQASARGYANVGRVNAYVNTGASTSVQSLGTSRTSITYMRQRNITVSASGFNANESVTLAFAGRNMGATNANGTGVYSRTFQLPANVPCGTVAITLTGNMGVSGSCAYTSTGTIVTETRRVVTTYTRDYYDPLAQTFTLDEARYVTGVDLWFTKRGASDVRVQIRDTLLGMPNRAILAEGTIGRGDIKQGQNNRIMFDRPVLLDANVEYALVVLTDTADHELAIARLGERNQANNTWLTTQAYETGVMLSSSNASTWTAHQGEDLYFRLIGAKFTGTKKAIDLGTIELDGTTDLLPLAEIDYPASGTEITFVLKDDRDKEVMRIQAGQSLESETVLTGTYKLSAELVGTAQLSPVLYSAAQFVAGRQSTDGTYITRAFPCGTNKKIRITLNCYTPGSSQIKVYVQTGADAKQLSSWTLATKPDTVNFTEIGDGWQERTYEAKTDLPTTRIKIELSGDPRYRPYAASLRAVVLDA